MQLKIQSVSRHIMTYYASHKKIVQISVDKNSFPIYKHYLKVRLTIGTSTEVA